MRVIGYIFFLFLIVLGVSFAVLNAEEITIHYYLGSQKVALSLLLLLVLGVGVSLGMLSMLATVWRLKYTNRRLQRQLNLAEKEVQNLRAIPLQDD